MRACPCETYLKKIPDQIKHIMVVVKVNERRTKTKEIIEIYLSCQISQTAFTEIDKLRAIN